MEPKKAAVIAAQYLKDLIPPTDQILVEEIEKVEDNPPYWLITLSHSPVYGSQANMTLAALSGVAPNRRDYKEFKINDNTGEVISMKIRKFS